MQKVTFDSFYYQLKTVGETLGVASPDFLKVQPSPLNAKLRKEKEQFERFINFIAEELNELESFKDALEALKRYVKRRGQLREQYSKSLNNYNARMFQHEHYQTAGA